MDYDIKYLQPVFYWGITPDPLVVSSHKLIPVEAKVLDLGCGEGRNAFYLAKKGFNVTALDLSNAGIKKLKEFAKKENLMIKTETAEAARYLASCPKFEAIYCLNLLQCLPQENIYPLINKIQSKTQKNGFNIIETHTRTIHKLNIKNKPRIAISLEKEYKDWNIIFYKEGLGPWETHGEEEHRHRFIRIVAQKI